MERTYNIPLRKEFSKVPKYKRAKRAVSAVKKFLSQHMKSDDIKLGKELNQYIWKRGIKSPPHHVKVVAKKDAEGVVQAELFGFEYSEPTKEELEKQLEEMAKAEEKKSEPKKSKSTTEAKKPADTDKEKKTEVKAKEESKKQVVKEKPQPKKEEPTKSEPKPAVKKEASKKEISLPKKGKSTKKADPKSDSVKVVSK